MKKIVWLATVCLVVIMIAIVSFTVIAAQETFVISGLGEDIEISVEELKDLPVIEKKVVSVNSSGDKMEYTITGALFSDLLEKYGKSQQDLKTIRLVAGDGYAIDVDQNILENRDIILGYLVNGNPIKEKYQPVRVVIPGERAMYWVKNLVKIKVLEVIETVNINRVYFLETIIPEVEQTEYTYYDSVDMAVKVSDLVGKIGVSTDLRRVKMVASDGLDKDEERDIFDSGYIKVTGDYAPMFLSPDIPKGMYVKDLLFVNYGENAICSLNQALKVLATATIDGKTGIKMSGLFEKTGLTAADKYSLKAVDGYSVEVTAADIEKGIIYLDEKGRVRSFFANLPKNTSVKYLYLIEPVN